MSLSHETMLELMGLADGELDGEQKARAERLVATNEEARRVVESLREAQVGAWLRGAMDERAAVAVAGTADAVMDAIAAGAVAPDGRDAPDEVRAEGVVVRRAVPRRRNVARFPIAFAAAGAALALAAGIALFVRSGKDRSDDLMPVASVVAPPVGFVVPSASVAEQPSAPAHAGAAGVEVNEIDAPSRGVSVFEIPLAAAAELAKQSHSSSVVIWVEDDPSEAK